MRNDEMIDSNDLEDYIRLMILLDGHKESEDYQNAKSALQTTDDAVDRIRTLLEAKMIVKDAIKNRLIIE